MGSTTVFFVALAAVLTVALAQVVSYNYDSFDASNKNDFQFNLGAPTYNSPAPPGYLLLTPSSGNQAGSIFLKNPISLQGANGFKASFSTRFSFQMTEVGGSQDTDGYGADGIVFVVNSVSNNGGSYGGGIGYSGITRSVGIEFDTWKNSEYSDIDGNHIGIDINGNIQSVQQASYPTRLNNGHVYYSWVDFNGDTKILEVRIATNSTRPSAAFISRSVDLVTILGTPNVYVGFTSATGGSFERHMVTSWSFTNQYAPIAVCGNGAIELGESCDGGDCCTSSCTFATLSTTCRASSGPCDPAEMCTGSSSTCPSNTFYPSNTTCRASAGPCDVPETCTGLSASCPTDSFASSSVICRAAAGICDAAEKCTGGSSDCPVDTFASNTTVCRASDGVCDVPEMCSGSSITCPADAYATSTVTCRTSAGVCDKAETCTGSSKTCPSDTYMNSSVVCRPSGGSCDIVETCSGSSPNCPSDSYAPSNLTCRTSAGPCDAAETCSGSSPSCPSDSFVPSTTICRPSTGACDVAEACTGSSVLCPVDSFSSASTVCRASNGPCDVAESCSGASALCPTDSYATSNVTCRASAGLCDVVETCSGSSPSCPSDSFAPSTATCRSSVGPCDVPETCTGNSASCPPDSFSPPSTVCRASNGLCDVPETCNGSSAVCPTDSYASSSVSCRPATDVCDQTEYCTGTSNSCPADSYSSSSTICRAVSGPCDVVESCSGTSASCPSNRFASSGTICRNSTGPFDPSETCTGSAPSCPSDESGQFETPCDGFVFNMNGRNYSWLDYDVISFNGFIANTGDIEGRAAVRHNAQVGSGWSVGYELHSPSTSNDNTLPYSMIVGDNFTFPSGAVYPDGSNSPYVGNQENLFVGDSFSGPSYLSSRVQGSCQSKGCLDSQFEAVRQCYGMVQAQFSNIPDNVATNIQWSGLTVSCNSQSDKTYYMTLTPQQMTQYTYVTFNGCSTTARWIITIAGAGDVLFTGASFPAPAGAIVYNVIGSARTINVKETNLNGNLLAPFNDLHQTSGVINGKVIANDITMSLQLNRAHGFVPQ